MFYDYGCNTELMQDYYGTADGCPTDYACNTIPGQEDTGCCYYDGATIDTNDDRYIHHCIDNSGCTTGWYCDPTDGTCHNLNQVSCTIDADCAASQTCNTTGGYCIPSNERDCAKDGDCALDEYCDISGYCIHADCYTNAKCQLDGSSKVCHLPTHTCETPCIHYEDCPGEHLCDIT